MLLKLPRCPLGGARAQPGDYQNGLWMPVSGQWQFISGIRIVRPAVVIRNVWGGNRTEVRAKAQRVLMSVCETVRRNVRPVLNHASDSLKAYAFPDSALPKPVALLAR